MLPSPRMSPSPSAKAGPQEQGDGALKEYTLEEIGRHTSEDSCWLVANGRVYDATRFLRSHPAGKDVLVRRSGGTDCSEDFSFHSKKARKLWDHYRIGKVKGYKEPGCVIC